MLPLLLRHSWYLSSVDFVESLARLLMLCFCFSPWSKVDNLTRAVVGYIVLLSQKSIAVHPCSIYYSLDHPTIQWVQISLWRIVHWSYRNCALFWPWSSHSRQSLSNLGKAYLHRNYPRIRLLEAFSLTEPSSLFMRRKYICFLFFLFQKWPIRSVLDKHTHGVVITERQHCMFY